MTTAHPIFGTASDYGPAETIAAAPDVMKNVLFGNDVKLAGRKLSAEISRCEGELTARIERHNQVREAGVDGLSEYDINICHNGDAGLALLTALHLTRNHVIYYVNRIAALKQLSDSTQPALFEALHA